MSQNFKEDLSVFEVAGAGDQKALRFVYCIDPVKNNLLLVYHRKAVEASAVANR